MTIFLRQGSNWIHEGHSSNEPRAEETLEGIVWLLRSFKGGAFPGLYKTKHRESPHGVCV